MTDGQYGEPTVGQIRKAIEGLPDDAPVFLNAHVSDTALNVLIKLDRVWCDRGALRVKLSLIDPEWDLDDEVPCPFCAEDPCQCGGPIRYSDDDEHYEDI